MINLRIGAYAITAHAITITGAHIISTITAYAMFHIRAHTIVYTCSLFCRCPEIKDCLLLANTIDGEYSGFALTHLAIVLSSESTITGSSKASEQLQMS